MPLVRVRRCSSVSTPDARAGAAPPAEGETSALEAERGGGVTLTLVQRHEGEAVWLAGAVEGGGDVPQVRASEVARVTRRRRCAEGSPGWVVSPCCRAQRPAAAAASASQRSRSAGGRTIRNITEPRAAKIASTMNPVR